MKGELQYQADIVKGIEAMGGWAKKLSNRFLVGIPDLGMVVRPFGHLIVEVKKVDHAPTTTREVDIGLTELQARNLRDIAGAGGNCGVLIIGPGPKRNSVKVWGYYGAPRTYNPKEFHECALVKSPSNPWDRLLPLLLPRFQAP